MKRTILLSILGSTLLANSVDFTIVQVYGYYYNNNQLKIVNNKLENIGDKKLFKNMTISINNVIQKIGKCEGIEECKVTISVFQKGIGTIERTIYMDYKNQLKLKNKKSVMAICKATDSLRLTECKVKS